MKYCSSIGLFPVRLRTCRAFITELRIEHSLHVQFSTFPMWSKSGSSAVPALYPYCAANFGLKYRKRLKKLFVFERTSKSNCDIPMSIPTGDTLEILQFEAVNVIYLYKIHITWISSYFCLQRFSSIFESTVRLAERLFV